jgi:predicted amidohydrolase
MSLGALAALPDHLPMPRGLIRIVTVAQPFCLDVGVTLARIERTLGSARQRGARLVVFPECTLGGFLREPGPGESAPVLPRPLDPDGPEIARLIEMAGDMVVCVGYTEAGPRAIYSSAVCVSGDGVLGRHRKVHLPPSERFAYTAGDGFAAFDTPVGRVGMLLCYDKLFAEASRTLAADGAEIIACMAAWPVDRRRPANRMAQDRQVRHFDVLDQARAIEHQVVWVSSNASGPWGPLEFPGRSKIVDPDGVVLASAARTGTAFAEIDPAAAIESVRLDIDHLADWRPHAYGAHNSSVHPLTFVA